MRQRFDYEKLGGSPLLGVNGTVLITHGSAKRRMIGYAVEVTAAAARANIPERIRTKLVEEGVDKSTAQRKTAQLHTDGAMPPSLDEVEAGG
jgi:glycerol-3-phosphate acyltransferase PlsX